MVNINERKICWANLEYKVYVRLSLDIFRAYGIICGAHLQVVRGSHFDPGFIYKGTIIKEAEKHNNIKIFK